MQYFYFFFIVILLIHCSFKKNIRTNSFKKHYNFKKKCQNVDAIDYSNNIVSTNNLANICREAKKNIKYIITNHFNIEKINNTNEYTITHIVALCDEAKNLLIAVFDELLNYDLKTNDDAKLILETFNIDIFALIFINDCEFAKLINEKIMNFISKLSKFQLKIDLNKLLPASYKYIFNEKIKEVFKNLTNIDIYSILNNKHDNNVSIKLFIYLNELNPETIANKINYESDISIRLHITSVLFISCSLFIFANSFNYKLIHYFFSNQNIKAMYLIILLSLSNVPIYELVILKSLKLIIFNVFNYSVDAVVYLIPFNINLICNLTRNFPSLLSKRINPATIIDSLIHYRLKNMTVIDYENIILLFLKFKDIRIDIVNYFNKESEIVLINDIMIKMFICIDKSNSFFSFNRILYVLMHNNFDYYMLPLFNQLILKIFILFKNFINEKITDGIMKKIKGTVEFIYDILTLKKLFNINQVPFLREEINNNYYYTQTGLYIDKIYECDIKEYKHDVIFTKNEDMYTINLGEIYRNILVEHLKDEIELIINYENLLYSQIGKSKDVENTYVKIAILLLKINDITGSSVFILKKNRMNLIEKYLKKNFANKMKITNRLSSIYNYIMETT
ncbi:hypothetical protein TCON_0845 [Astathelohania contejeani]|uniref:Uncharacterized protein n=1 Tax=Astathelohania contejeani TaxID=164912 RepID=A0ABQ7I0L2_9MICR|nr:hypothetical protein TCON_0845 [Thelohania contejeani]